MCLILLVIFEDFKKISVCNHQQHYKTEHILAPEQNQRHLNPRLRSADSPVCGLGDSDHGDASEVMVLRCDIGLYSRRKNVQRQRDGKVKLPQRRL